MFTHVHTIFSAKDALASPEANVERAAQLGFKALAITDHGNGGGWVRHYLACKKAGIKPLLGIEAYVAVERSREGKGRKRPKTFHLTMLAINEQGYRNLVWLHNLSHRNFYFQPVLDLGDLAQAAEIGRLDGIYGLSGCWFGLGPTALREGSPTAVLSMLKALSNWFGAGFAIELMHHEIKDAEHDDSRHIEFLHSVSERLNLPTVISQDSHYVYAQDRADHDMLCWLAGWGMPGDKQFPGKLGYHLVSADEIKHLYPKPIWDKAMDGLLDLQNMAHLQVPELDEFMLRVPDMSLTKDPYTELVEIVEAALYKATEGNRSRKRYFERLADELAVIKNSGFAGYLMLVRMVCQELNRRGIVWAVRGSASGSLVCQMLGITQFDPITWRLRFDRFLSTDRTKPPDIDIDMDPDYRDEMFEWLGQRFHTLRVGAWSKYGLRAEDDDLYDPDRPQAGSLPVAYKYAVGKILEGRYGSDRKRWPAEAHQQWRADISTSDWRKLESLAKHKALKNYSTHAAGIIITDDERILEQIPQLKVTGKDYMVSAFDKDDVERIGLVKLDLLNLKLLTAVRVWQEVSGVHHETIPPNDSKTFSRIRSGNVVGMFQLEGGATKHGLRRLRPRKVEDLVAAMALFRTATMESGTTDDFLRRRTGDKAVPERHPILNAITKDTYGTFLYQEQAIEVFRALDMSQPDVERALKAIKASNAAIGNAALVLQELLATVGDLCVAKGMSTEDIAWLQQTLASFASYSFNRSHAVAYGVWAYKSAWYATNHPVAFWTGMLTAHSGNSEKDRIRQYLTVANASGVAIRPAHVSTSGITYTANLKTQAIYKGLLSIDGIGEKTAAEIVRHQPYASLDEFATKVSNRLVTGSKDLGLGVHPADCKGAVALLHHAKALKGLAFE